MRTMPWNPRRRVDWSLIDGAEPSRAHLVLPTGQTTGLAAITSALLSDPSVQTIYRVLREAVEFARIAIRLERVSIYLVGPGGRSMVGTWGTDISGHTTDERDLTFDIDDMVRQFFSRYAQGYAWSVYQDCPLMTHESGRSRTLGRGWLACLPIQGGGPPLGILFNDSAISGAPVDDGKQARAALLCSLLGRALELCYPRLFDPERSEGKPQHPLVRNAAHLLVADPSLSFAELAKQLRVSKGHLTRTFKRCADASIVGYRNELRLAQFLSQVNEKPLLAAALAAGFGSYAQFHRVFRSRFGKAPREYIFEQRVAPPSENEPSPR